MIEASKCRIAGLRNVGPLDVGAKRRAPQTLCYFCCMIRVSPALLIAAGLVVAQDATLQWMPVSSAKIDVAGLPWFQENRGEFWRLPARSRETFPPAVWNLSLDPTGGRIRFRTDSSTVALRLEWPRPPGMRNMHFFGQSGVDLYVRNSYWGTAVPDKDAAPGKVYEHVYFRTSRA